MSQDKSTLISGNGLVLSGKNTQPTSMVTKLHDTLYQHQVDAFRQKHLTWTNGDQVPWYLIVAPGINELICIGNS